MTSTEKQSAFVLITGASRGIGREFAVQLSTLFDPNKSVFFLFGRNEDALNNVKKEIFQIHPSLEVRLFFVNFSESFKLQIDDCIRTLENKNEFDLRLLIHNAGSLGDITKKSSNLDNEEQWQTYLQTNLVSTILLNNAIYNAFKADYSVAKAAREAFFRSFAVEHPNCRVLNYSPGPVDTDMHTDVCKRTYDENVKNVFSKRYEDGPELDRKLLTTSETVKKFLSIFQKNKFESGARIDYFDKIDEKKKLF